MNHKDTRCCEPDQPLARQLELKHSCAGVLRASPLQGCPGGMAGTEAEVCLLCFPPWKDGWSGEGLMGS